MKEKKKQIIFASIFFVFSFLSKKEREDELIRFRLQLHRLLYRSGVNFINVFTYKFFVWTSFRQLFLVTFCLWQKMLAKNARVKRWWNCHWGTWGVILPRRRFFLIIFSPGISSQSGYRSLSHSLTLSLSLSLSSNTHLHPNHLSLSLFLSPSHSSSNIHLHPLPPVLSLSLSLLLTLTLFLSPSSLSLFHTQIRLYLSPICFTLLSGTTFFILH